MSEPISLSICINRDQDTTALEALVKAFNPLSQVTTILWEDEWKEFTQYALYQVGPDISQVGAPLIGDMIAMNALRPFSSRELAMLGGEAAFEPVAWQSARRTYEGKVWAIPWLADPRVIFYWKDMLEQAGVEVNSGVAFQSPEQIQQTFQRLQDNGIAAPWVLPTAFGLVVLQTAASWIWGSGGEFVSPDGQRTLFNEAEARAGLSSYFDLYRYMPQHNQPLDDVQTLKLFTSRQTAVTMGSLFFGAKIIQNIAVEDRPRLGFALPPGPSCVGGANLVVWKHTRHDHAAVELARFLVSPQAQVEYCPQIGYLPVHLDALAAPPFSTEPHYQVYIQALKTGRPFPVIQAGGLFENQLCSSLTRIWRQVIEDPSQDIHSLLSTHLEPLSKRLNAILSQYGTVGRLGSDQ